MEKTARRPSTDPVQERLRQNKANWNKEVSTFINDLIHLKKTMNGWPSKFHKERSRIIEPIPADPATIIGSLAGDFQDIVNKGNSVIQEQLNYSKTRRKRQPKQLGLPFPPPAPGTPAATPATPPASTPATPELSKQLELGLASDNNYYLISEASNPLTRFFHRLLSPGIGLTSEGARIRKYRMSLLNAALQTYKDLKKVQSSIVGSGPQSIFVASKLLDKAENNWVFLSSGFKAFQDTLPKGAADTGSKIDIPPSLKGAPPTEGSVTPAPGAGLTDPQVMAAMGAVQDIQRYANTFKGVAGMSDLKKAAQQFDKALPADKLKFAGELLRLYRQVLIQLSANKMIPVQNSFADVIAMETKNEPPTTASSQDQLQAVAQGFLGKLRHQISPFDKTSAFRLDIYKMAAANRKILDKIMDHLSTGLNAETLSPLMAEAGSNMLKIKTLMNGLTSTIRGVGYQPEFMSMLERGRLGDYGVDLDPKQKIDLERMLKQKQLRELTQMYRK